MQRLPQRLPWSLLFRLDRKILELQQRRSGLIQDQRKKDTKKKIFMGNLLVKADLHEADPAFILGALLQATAISPDEPKWREMSQLGVATFRKRANDQRYTGFGEERRQIVRNLIALGGIAVKAGIHNADSTFIMGVMASAASLSCADPKWREMHQMGQAAFAATADEQSSPEP